MSYFKPFSCLTNNTSTFRLDTKSAGRQSVNSAKHGPESDTDSMAEYGDGDTGEHFDSYEFPMNTFVLFLFASTIIYLFIF